MNNYIKKQIETNKNINLLFKGLSDIVKINEDFKDNLLELKKKNIEISDQVLNDTIKNTLERIYEINQFINIDENGIAKLNKLYRNTYRMVNENNFNIILEKHFKNLSSIISNYYPERYKIKLHDIEKIGSVVNEQYSFNFQLKLFDFSINELNEPIIDIGCGSKAEFVRMLQLQGKDAFGIDRIINSETEKIIQTSWFDYHLFPESWGTIYSNMSFSNHFIYALKNDEKQISKYLQKYQELLKALRNNGKFIYAPSLPEVEAALDTNQYEIKQIQMNSIISITKIKKIAI